MAIGGLEQRPSYPQRHVSRGGPEWESDIEANVNLDVINALLGGVGKAIGNETMAKGTLIPTPKAIMADMARTSEENRRSEADVSQMGALRAQGIDIPDSDYDRVLRARGLLTGAAPAPGAGVPSPGTSTPVPVGPGPVLPPDLNAGILPAAAAGAVPIVGPETPLSGGEQAMGLREAPPVPTAPAAMRGEPAPARESTGNPMLDMFASFMGMMEGGKGAAERPTTTTPGGVRLSRPAGKEGTGGLKASDFISLIKEVGEQGRHKEKEKRGKEEFEMSHDLRLTEVNDQVNQTKVAMGKFLSDNQDKIADNQRDAALHLPLMTAKVVELLGAGKEAEASAMLEATNGMARQSGTGQFVVTTTPKNKLLGFIPWGGGDKVLEFVPASGMKTGEEAPAEATVKPEPETPGRSVGDFLGTAPAAAAVKPAGKTKLDAIKEIPAFFQKSSKASPDFDKSLAGQSQYESLIQKEVAKYKDVPNMSPELVRAVMAQESRFNTKARSSAGAEGLMQLMPPAAKDQKVTNRKDPAEGVRGGVGHLAMLLKRYDGDIDKTLAAYNWGQKHVKKDKPLSNMPKETRDYVGRVKGYLQTAQKTGRMGPSTTALASAKALSTDKTLARAVKGDTTVMGLVDLIDVARRGGHGDSKFKERALAHGATPEQIALAFRVAGQG